MDTLMIIVPSLEGGGQEKVSTITSSVLADCYNMIFVVFTDKDAKYKISGSVRFVNLGIPTYSDFIRKAVFVFFKSWKIKRLKKEFQVSSTISFGRPANLVNCLSRLEDKVICSIRNSSFLETQKHNSINHLIYAKADKIVFISEGQKQLTEKYFPMIQNKSCIIHNPCDTGLISKMSNEEAEIPWKEGRILVSCGRLESVKCFINLCNAFKIAKRKCPDIKLLIIGEGKLRHRIDEYIRSIGLEKEIILLGFEYNPYKYMSKCDVFVFPSSREGFANVIIEALACELPVISTDYHFGAREILAGNTDYGIHHGYTIEEYGILTPAFIEGNDHQPETERMFADAMIRLLTDDKLYSEFKSKARLRSMDFGLKEYRSKWMDTIAN